MNKEYILLVVLAAVFILPMITPANATWWNISWSYKEPCYINTTSPGSLTDFPVLCTMNTTALISTGKMNDTCKDLRVLSSIENLILSYEIENNTCNTSYTNIWIKIPATTANANDTVYIYYGNNAATDAQNKIGVWSNGYRGVWHFANDTIDSLNGIAATTNANITKFLNSTVCHSYTCINVTGYTYWTAAFIPPVIGPFGESAWATTYDNATRQSMAGTYTANYKGGFGIELAVPAGTHQWDWSGGTLAGSSGPAAAFIISNNAWFYIAGITNGRYNRTLYYNGTSRANNTADGGTTLPSNNLALLSTNYSALRSPWKGLVDEFRLHNVTRNEYWFQGEWGQTFSFGSEQSAPPNTCTITNNSMWLVTCSDNCTINGGAYNVTNVTTTGTGFLTFNNTNFTFNTFFLGSGCKIAINTSNSRFMRSPYS